jgi:structural maintenance of chromosome 3 (chondroitin sulfate proteoglycan 6)
LQRDDTRAFSKQQKLAERYLAKRQMLSSRKDECSRNIRDLGVLPEEAFEKYTKEKSEKVRTGKPTLMMADKLVLFFP